MAAIRVAELFASIGVKADVTQLNKFQKRLAGIKKQLLELKRLSRTQLAPKANLGQINALNASLTRTLALRRQINAQGGISGLSAAAGVAGAGGGRKKGGGGGRGSNKGFFGGAAAGSLGLRGGLGRNFLGGFTAIVAVKSLFEASAAMEGIEVALGAVTREGETTAEVMSFLRFESNRLGFELKSSALEYAKLAAAGNSVNLEQETIKQTFIAAQEAARVFNLSVADTEGVLKAFTQIISKGKITAEELRNQLGDRLPGAVGIFAKALGVTTQELSEMLEQGEVMADDDTLLKVAAELRGTVATQVAAAANNATAALNRLKTQFFEFGASIGKSGLADVFKLLLIGGGKLFKILGPIFRGLAFAIRTVLVPLQALGRLFVRFTDAVPNFSAALIALGVAAFFLRNATLAMARAWIIAAAPIIGAALAIGSLLLLIDDLATALDGGDSVLGRLAEDGEGFFAVLSRIILAMGEFFIFAVDLTAALLTWSFDPLTDSLDRFIKKINKLLGLEAASGLLTDLFEFIDIGGLNADVAGPQISSPRDFINSPEMQVNVEVTGDTEVIKGVVTTVNEGERRAAQAEQGNNE